MSRYLSVYAITQKNGYIMVGDWSSSTKVYELLNRNAPYGDTMPVDKDCLCSLRDEVSAIIAGIRADIAKSQEEAEFVSKVKSASLDDLLDRYHEIISDIDHYKTEIDEWEYAASYLCFLINLITDNEYIDRPIKLVMGIECSEPKLGDKENQ